MRVVDCTTENHGEDSHGFTHDVFVSFRGEDTRDNFTGHLVKRLQEKGIKVFFDEDHLGIGKGISSALLTAIEESKILIIVFSHHYASSKWCLTELEKIILSTENNNKQLAFPIFYHVDPSDIRNQKNSYGQSMIHHENLFGKEFEKIQDWRSALSKAGHLKGQHIHTGSEAKQVEEIVEKVCAHIAHKPLHVDEDLVGLKHHVEKVKSLLHLKDDYRCMLGIYGPSGVGKTELVKVLYNEIAHQFEAASFLANVGENSKKKGLEHLQKTLLSEMSEPLKIELGSTYKGISEIKKRLQKKKVILVLDGVDNSEQIHELAGRPDWFGLGSRIIITTEDKALLDLHQFEKFYYYKMSELNDQHSLELFSQKLFKKSHPERGYENVSARAVSYAKGRPLAIKAIAHSLSTKSLKAWQDAMDDFEKIPDHIQDVLRVSYDAFEHYAETAFVDISCLPKGKRKKYRNSIRPDRVAIHRCLLALQSEFFHELYKKGNGGLVKEGRPFKPRYLMSDLVPYGRVGYEAFIARLHDLYTGKLKASPPEVATCVDQSCVHDACRPAINYALELMYASATFQMQELIFPFQRHLQNFVDKALVEDVIPILLAAHNFQLNQLLSQCIQRVARSDLDSISLEKELPHELVTKIKSLRFRSPPESTTDAMEVDLSMNDKSIKRILKALDSDDVELLNLLLKEYSVTLDDAYALHYACAYCEPKVVLEVLTLGLADILLKNPRGYTALHVAARRKEPSILVALLNKGACASETTRDGQTALSISQRLTRFKDYHEKTVQGKESHKDRLCVDVLEREMRRNSMSLNMSVSSQLTDDDLQMRLCYLEDKVAFARLFFPSEARVAIENAEADSTSLLKGNINEVDLNETPSDRTRKLQLRLHALVKTVEIGRRFFPHCSEVLDKFLEDEDMANIFVQDNGSEEEQRTKKARFTEIKDEVQKAYQLVSLIDP